MTRTEEFLSVLQPVGPEFLSRFTHHDDLYLSQSIDQVLKSQSMQYQRPGLSLATFWRHPSQEQIYFSVLSLPHHSPGHHWDLSGRSRVHLHCSIPPAGCLSGPGRVSAEERRLAAEEGSYSLKTWLRKISRGWASSSTGPQPRPVSTVLLSYLSPHWTGMVGRLLLDPLIHQPPRASRPSYLSRSRTEDWQQKKDCSHRRPGRGRPRGGR